MIVQMTYYAILKTIQINECFAYQENSKREVMISNSLTAKSMEGTVQHKGMEFTKFQSL